MTRFAANLSMMFTEVPFLERFAAAADAGFSGVEYLFPYAYDAAELADALHRNRLEQALFNAPPGDWDAGERGIAALAGRDEEFAEGIARALHYATALDCPRIHVMAGTARADDAAARDRFVERVRVAADAAAASGRTIMLEPINPIDMPGYLLNDVSLACELIERIDRANVRLQLDLYHAQIIAGDLTRLIRRTAPLIGHVQIASVPDRAEPDGGELALGHLLAELDSAGYDGWVGCEYRPAGDTRAGLGWLDHFTDAHPRPAAEHPIGGRS